MSQETKTKDFCEDMHKLFQQIMDTPTEAAIEAYNSNPVNNSKPYFRLSHPNDKFESIKTLAFSYETILELKKLGILYIGELDTIATTHETSPSDHELLVAAQILSIDFKSSGYVPDDDRNYEHQEIFESKIINKTPVITEVAIYSSGYVRRPAMPFSVGINDKPEITEQEIFTPNPLVEMPITYSGYNRLALSSAAYKEIDEALEKRELLYKVDHPNQ